MRTSLAQRAIMNATMHACLLRVERTLGRIDTTLGRIDMTVDTVDTTLATIGRLLEGRAARRIMSVHERLYDRDLYAWTVEQSDHLLREDWFALDWVAYPLAADNSIGPLLSRLRGAQQPVVRPRHAFSAPRSRLLAHV